MEPTPGSGTSLYVHMPFCKVKCGYCDFNSYTVEDQGVLDRFLSAFAEELENARLPDHPVSIYIGGGTPTLLDEARLESFVEILGRHVDR